MTSLVRHASCVAWAGRGLLILGPSGSGKSGLALQLMALGADLVADDRTELRAAGGVLTAWAPAMIQGLIEARGLGLLRAAFLPEAAIVLVVDLGLTETQRLPPQRDVTLLGITLPLVLGSSHTHFPSSILCYLKGARFA